jgi:tetratricopeptide (TPR) repeat protein
VAYDEPSEAKRQYILGAIDFYLENNKLEEVRASYDRATELRLLDNDMRKAIGDKYFAAGLYDRAIGEYQQILASDPGRRDVVERVAEYYEQSGDDALESGKLEDAQEAYSKSVAANSLRTDAQRKLLDVEDQIYKRDERMLAQRSATEEAREFENRAEESVVQRDYARAITLLREAETRYASVTDEFPEEARVAALGLRNVSLRLKELKSDLVANSQSLSGSGYLYDVRQIAGQTPDMSTQALKGLVKSEYDAAVKALGTHVEPE